MQVCDLRAGQWKLGGKWSSMDEFKLHPVHVSLKSHRKLSIQRRAFVHAATAARLVAVSSPSFLFFLFFSFFSLIGGGDAPDTAILPESLHVLQDTLFVVPVDKTHVWQLIILLDPEARLWDNPSVV